MTLQKLLALSCLLLPMIAGAHSFETNQRVPPVGIADRGELILDNDKFSYKSWNSAQLPGKVRIVQHIAGRTSAKEKKCYADRGNQGGQPAARQIPDHHDRQHR
ncbi:Predicted transcriptional regulator [Citrobacter braakii]|nr:Predicted transcriptional regulator [Citrobacter braakii]